MSTTQVLALGGVILLGAMSPGPDFVIVTRSAAMSGRRAARRVARRGEYDGPAADRPSATSPVRAFRQGLLTNLLNPKVAVWPT